MTSPHATLYDPLRLGDIALANRIVMAPLTRNRAGAGQVPTDLMVQYYRQRANPATGDTITLAAPGIRMAQSAAERAITVIATAARNVAFSRNAILLATRLPALPVEGDLANDRMTITDPASGISLEFAVYPGYRMNVYHVSICWGVAAIKPEHIAVLLG